NDSIQDLLLMPGFTYPLQFGKHFTISTGLDLAIKRNLDESFIYQGYANFSYGNLKLIAGIQEYTLGQYSEELSSGSFLVSNNARPIPRIGIGFYDYVDVPFTKGYLQVKGALNHGWLENGRLDHSRFNLPYLHEKFAYIRTQKIPVNPYAGISHFALYGGENANGRKIGVDYWAVFTGSASTVSGLGSDAVNAAGEHLGVFDLGFYSRIKNYDITLYYQLPVTDQTGMESKFSRNQDFFTGILIETEDKNIVNGILFEFIHTEQQSGLGIPDPIVDGKFISLWKEEDREWLKEYYTGLGYPVSDIDTEIEWRSFLQAYINYGYLFGGRVDFYNNPLYRHIYQGRIIGTPLFQTLPEIKKMSGYEETEGPYVVNNRVWAYHVGVSGYLSKDLDYRLMVTYTSNKGAWQEYGGRTRWDGIAIDPDYEWFWMGDLTQWYTLLEANYTLPGSEKFAFKAAIGYDFGDLDHNFGMLFGISYRNYVKF
ncbi:MAG: hypothetical protein KFF73_11820, partial [Cyclobacteriaceae bacterium]|nr:hypothetical protein [Cyclobacteriaceae bacterium]